MGPRLAAVAAAVPAGARVADVGCGDGQLTLALRAAGHAVIPIERWPGPAARARERLGEVRLGDGLMPLTPGEVDVAVAAGLGGETIAAILERSPAVARSLRLLVLQPMQRAQRLRDRLAAGGFDVVEERPAVERGRRYTVLLVRPR